MFTYIPFQVGECIHDVSPTGNGDECCWCCACPFGIQSNGHCKPPPSAIPPRGTEEASRMSNPPPCFIEMTIGGRHC